MWRVPATGPGGGPSIATVEGLLPPVLVTGERKGMMVHQGSHGTLSVGEFTFFRPPYPAPRKEWFRSTRLETRTKESNAYARTRGEGGEGASVRRRFLASVVSTTARTRPGRTVKSPSGARRSGPQSEEKTSSGNVPDSPGGRRRTSSFPITGRTARGLNNPRLPVPPGGILLGLRPGSGGLSPRARRRSPSPGRRRREECAS